MFCHRNSAGGQYYQLGATKIFIRYPENLFLLEELREGAFGKMASTIQRAWRRYTARSTFIKMRRIVSKQFTAAGKQRRRESMFQTYEGDYIGYPGHVGIRGIVLAGSCSASLGCMPRVGPGLSSDDSFVLALGTA